MNDNQERSLPNFMLVGGVSAYGLGILAIATVALAGKQLTRQRLSQPTGDTA